MPKLDRAKPGSLSLASDFGLAGIVTRWMLRASKSQIVYVPYKEVSQQLQDLVAGRAQAMPQAASRMPATMAFFMIIPKWPGPFRAPAQACALPRLASGDPW